MKLVIWQDWTNVAFGKTSGVHRVTMEPHVPYVMSDSQLQSLLLDKNIAQVVYKITDLEPRVPNFVAKEVGRHGRLLLYNGAGGFGDQVMTWPVARILTQFGFEVTALTDPGNTLCWQGLDKIGLLTLPLPYSVFQLFDHYLLVESPYNHDSMPDQRHPVDTLLAKCGLDPMEFLDEQKTVCPSFTPAELAGAAALARKFAGDKPVACYQLAASLQLRSLSLDKSIAVLDCLSSTFPDLHWLALYDILVTNHDNYRLKANALRNNVDALYHPRLRELWALLGMSKVVVGPDSMAIQVAGAQGVPTVGLWSTVHPSKRVKYIKNHVPLWQTGGCPHAPCYGIQDRWPHYCPDRDTRTECAVLSAVTPEMVCAAVSEALAGQATQGTQAHAVEIVPTAPTTCPDPWAFGTPSVVSNNPS